MKTRLYFLIAACCCATVLSAATIERVQIGDLYYELDTDAQTAAVTTSEYSDYAGDVVIPATVPYDGIDYSVTSIGYYAFARCGDLTSISIPSSITSMVGAIVYGCYNLTSIIVDADNPKFCDVDGVLFSKDMQAIHACPGAKKGEYSIPNSVKYISNGAFYGCSGLTSVTIPESVTMIGESAFYLCSGLTSITIPNSVTSMDWLVFYECTGLKSVTIGNSVNSIGDDTFWGCTGLTSVIIGNSVTSIGESAFSECISLTSLTIPETVEMISNNAFYNVPNVIYHGTAEGSPWGAKCVNGIVDGWFVFTDDTRTVLTSCSPDATGDIVIPSTVVSISDYAFHACLSGITSISIPESVTSIGDYAFSDCTYLTSITIPKSVVSIGIGAFSNSLTSVIWNSKNYKDPSSLSRSPFYTICTNLTSFIFGDEVESIPDYLCHGMNRLSTVTVPNSVTAIGYDAFGDVPNVIYHGTATGSPWGAKCVNGVVDGPFLFSDETKTELKLCLSGKGEVEIPNTVTRICEQAFANCNGMTSVIIPNTVEYIGERAFYNCTSLSTLTIPASVLSIENKAFYSCLGLTSIEVDAKNKKYCSVDGVLYNRDQSILILCPAKKSGAFTIPDGVLIIDVSAFYFCSGLTSIHIPNSVRTIRSSAFKYCMSLTSLDIPNSVTTLEANTFTSCRAMTDLTIGDGVTEIGGSAFNACFSLTNLTIGKRIARIGGETFDGCNSLKKITCYAATPPEMGGNVFWRANISNCTLYVLNVSLEQYKEADTWKDIPTILPIVAEESDAEQLIAKPTDYSVVIDWPSVTDAVEYTIVIKKGDDVICTLTFDALGQLLGISFSKPARNGSHNNAQPRMATQTATGWQYQISGLEANTEYSYIVKAVNSASEVIYDQQITFTTKNSATGVETIDNGQLTIDIQKVMRNGQLYIIHDGQRYNVTGRLAE